MPTASIELLPKILVSLTEAVSISLISFLYDAGVFLASCCKLQTHYGTGTLANTLHKN